MALAIHVPACSNPGCEAQLKQLHQIFTELRCIVADDLQIYGRFSCQFKDNINKCSFTILHYCQQLWQRIGNLEELFQMTGTSHEKIICISFDRSHLQVTERHKVDEFFQDFNVQVVTTEPEIRKFANDVFKAWERSNSGVVEHVGPRVESRISVVKLPRPHIRSESILPGSYINAPRELEQIIERIQFLYMQVVDRALIHAGTFLKYPDAIGYMYAPTAFLRLESQYLEICAQYDFSKMKKVTDLRDFLNQLKEEDTFNFSFCLHKIIIELYNSGCALGLATVAVCPHHVLAERSVSMLELLIFRGHLGNSFITMESLQEVQRVLAVSLVQQSQSVLGVVRQKSSPVQNNREDTMKRLCNLLILLQMKKLIKALKEDKWMDYDRLNAELSNTLDKCKANDYIKTYLKTLEVLLGKSMHKLTGALQNLLGDISVEELCRDIWSKELPVNLLYVFQCIKKLFASMDVEIVNILKKCLKSRSRISILQSPVNEVVAAILFRGLTHFVTFCLKEASHRSIHEICVKVLPLIDSISRQQSANDVMQAQQALLFDPSPDIRRAVIQQLEEKDMYSLRIDTSCVKEIENILCPYFHIDAPLPTTDHVIMRIGRFHQYPVILKVYRPQLSEHKGEKLPVLQQSQHARLKAMADVLKQLSDEHVLKLFAYRFYALPHFYIMEHYADNLQDFLANRSMNRKYCQQKTLLLYLLQISSALEHCHSKKIAHCNLTAASVSVVGEDMVKLGEFHAAVDINTSQFLVDTSDMPTRWMAVETLKCGQVSLASDVGMLGNLSFEILTHGSLPYSQVNTYDQEYVSLAFYFFIQIPKENCFKEEHHKLMLSCTHYNPKRRPRIGEVKRLIQSFIESSGSEDASTDMFHHLENHSLKPSTNFAKGIPKTTGGHVMKFQPSLTTTFNNSIEQFKVGQFLLFKEIVPGNPSKKFIAKVHSGILDVVAPKIDITTDRMGSSNNFVIDIYVPASCAQTMTSYIESEHLSQTPESCLALILKTAEMLKTVHDNHFELGELKVSNLFVEVASGDVKKVYPISLKRLRYEAKNKRSSQSSLDMSSASEKDVYIFGNFMKEVYHLVDRAQNLGQVYEQLPGILETDGGFNASSIYPESISHLIEKCLRKMPQDRPDLQEIIRELSFEINTVTSRFASSSSTLSSTSSSAHSYSSSSELCVETSVTTSHELCVLNPSDDESASEETLVKRPVNSKTNEYSKPRGVFSSDGQTKPFLRLRNIFKKRKPHTYESIKQMKISEGQAFRSGSMQGGNYSRPLPPLPFSPKSQQGQGCLGDGTMGVQRASESEDVDDSVRDWNDDYLAELAYMMDDLFLYSGSSEQSRETGGHQFSNYDVLELADASRRRDDDHGYYCNLRHGGDADARPEMSTPSHLAAPPLPPRRNLGSNQPSPPPGFSDTRATSPTYYIPIDGESEDYDTADSTDDNPRDNGSTDSSESVGDDPRGTSATAYATIASIGNTVPTDTSSITPTFSLDDNDSFVVYV